MFGPRDVLLTQAQQQTLGSFSTPFHTSYLSETSIVGHTPAAAVSRVLDVAWHDALADLLYVFCPVVTALHSTVSYTKVM
jgi:hypothetical protein